jgi:hypothetical protein
VPARRDEGRAAGSIRRKAPDPSARARTQPLLACEKPGEAFAESTRSAARIAPIYSCFTRAPYSIVRSVVPSGTVGSSGGMGCTRAGRRRTSIGANPGRAGRA